ncbi:MAG: bifunctional tetrahydrofolate synthase/dihydrofolate synthase [Oceanospirillales bacterium]|nr:MAG: bifunctional tetrahydrofolate synthase/dihydrofolate synthase [Oceanospirillales bacterium]
MSPKQLNESSPLATWLEEIEACHPAEIELGLDRMRQVAERLPIDLNESFKIIIGGTNGKGTSVRLLETILLEAGYSVGTYTSPHFVHYNERICLSGMPVDDSLICAAFTQIEAQREDIPLTYFEFGTLAALLIFAEQKPDFLLLEVGLGGRLDSVNLVDGDVSLVTTIALDHTEWLGPDRESIGFEKAGIFRSARPAVCGDASPPQSLIDHASNIGSPLFCQSQHFSFAKLDSDTWSWQGVDKDGQPVSISDLPMPRLPLQNASSVLQVLQLIPVTPSLQHIRQGLQKAQLMGRMQPGILSGFPCILDVAHNPESAAYLANHLADLLVIHPQQKNHLVLGMLADKDMVQVCELLLPVVEHWHLVTLDTPRGASSSKLKAILDSLGVPPSSVAEYDNVKIALLQLPQLMDPAARVVIAGSFFTVTDALSIVERADGEQG